MLLQGNVFRRQGAVFGHGLSIHAKRRRKRWYRYGGFLSVYSSIEYESVVAEGSVVKRGQTIPGGIIVAGNPAKKMRDISEKDRDFLGIHAKKFIESGTEISCNRYGMY